MSGETLNLIWVCLWLWLWHVLVSIREGSALALGTWMGFYRFFLLVFFFLQLQFSAITKGDICSVNVLKCHTAFDLCRLSEWFHWPEAKKSIIPNAHRKQCPLELKMLVWQNIVVMLTWSYYPVNAQRPAKATRIQEKTEIHKVQSVIPNCCTQLVLDMCKIATLDKNCNIN